MTASDPCHNYVRNGTLTSIRLYKGALSGAGGEHDTVEDVVRVGEPVEGTPSLDRDGRIGTPAMSEWRPKRAAQGEDNPDFDQFPDISSAL